MARPLRIDYAGGWYHLTSRGNERRRIYRDDGDRAHFLELLEELVLRFRWRLHAYVLMENHYHLMVETPEANLSAGMHWLQVSYSVWFNRRHSRVGHLFQGRFKGIVLDRDTWGVALSHYMHLNPVRVDRLGLGKAARASQGRGSQAPVSSELIEARLQVLGDYRWRWALEGGCRGGGSGEGREVGGFPGPNRRLGPRRGAAARSKGRRLEVGRIGRVVRRLGLSDGRGCYKEGNGTVREGALTQIK